MAGIITSLSDVNKKAEKSVLQTFPENTIAISSMIE